MMKKPGILFTPGRKLQEARENVTFLRVKDTDEIAEGGDSESPDEI